MAIAFPDIDPIIFSLGPFIIRWYALAYLAGFLLGWRYTLHIVGLDEKELPEGTDKESPPPDAVPGQLTKIALDDFLAWIILGVILGGRFGYVLFYQSAMFIADPLEIFKVWHGGMSFHGGALGAIGAMIVYAWVKKLPTLKLTDVVCAAVPIGLFFGRIANFINGELYGRVTSVSWGVEFPTGGGMPRHPSQLYEAGLEGLLLFLLLGFMIHIKKIRFTPGIVSAVFLIGYGFSRFFVEFFREPDAHLGFIFNNAITMGQVLSVPMILVGVIAIVIILHKKNKTESIPQEQE